MSGELAAILTAACFAYNAILFNIAGRRVTSPVVNRMRLLGALVVLASLHWILRGTPFPLDAGWERFNWLAVSAIIGFVLGDAALFEALVRIGARYTVLLTTLIPIFSSLIAWLLLGERILLTEWGFILLTMAGIAWVITERRTTGIVSRRHLFTGLGLGIFAALAQATGLVFSKLGLSDEYSVFSATLVRIAVATLILWLPIMLRRRVGEDFRRLKDRVARNALLKGTFVGPVAGVMLSLYAVQQVRVGIASTLMSLIPIFLLPLGWFMLKERVSWRALLGTILAVSGAAGLLLG
ncbi:MAG: DMT family transporter [Candidatus Delongbacteria bacterium]|nr:DMT family transporter [Candidatus Delongbacteria bacterium]